MLLSETGNMAKTLGEARRNAFEYATDLLADKLGGDTTVSVETEFVQISGFTGALFAKELVTLPDNPDSFYYPSSLAEAISGQELNEEDHEVIVKFAENAIFHYSFELRDSSRYDFIETALHELIHALGFTSSITSDGSFKKTSKGTDQIEIFDAQLYSEKYGEFLINLSDAQRLEALTSDTDLLWEGTTGGQNPCSYGQYITKIQPGIVMSTDGKLQLLSRFPFGQISHLNSGIVDVMAPPDVATKRNINLSLGMLKDMGWEIEDENFPTDCMELKSPSPLTPVPPPKPKPVLAEGSGCTLASNQETKRILLPWLLILLCCFVPRLTDRREKKCQKLVTNGAKLLRRQYLVERKEWLKEADNLSATKRESW